MKKEIVLEMEESIIDEFEELLISLDIDEEGKPIKFTIRETLRKYIIDNINKRRIELATSQAAISTIKLEESDIIIERATIP